MSPDRIVQLKYVFWAFVVALPASMDYIAKFGIEFYPAGYIFMLCFVYILAYAIVRHQLLDIEVIIKKTLVFAGLLASTLAILIIPTLAMQEYIFRAASFGGRMIGLTISGIIIIFSMRRIEAFLINVTDKYLFQKKYDYKELLKTFTSEVLTVINLDNLVNLTVSKLSDIIKVDSCKLILSDRESNDPILKSIDWGKDHLLKNGELVIPLKRHDEKLGALFLGKKKSDEGYTQDDLDILLPLARTLAIAISNAQLFDQLSKTQAEAAQKEKMAVIGTLVAGMAHEIRNPTTTIRIFSEYLPDKLNNVEFRNKYRNIVVKEADKIDHIIQTLIDFSGEETGSQTEEVSLNEAIGELISLIGLNMDISGRIEFVKSIAKNLPNISVDRKEFDEILLNLAQNAINAIEGKGTITFSACEKGDMVELDITDTGCGITEEAIKHVFSPFYTTRTKGYGLGLFVVNQLVIRNRGRISVASRTGEGTTFRLEFRIK